MIHLMPELVTVATIYDPEEAHVACGFLRANGVDALLGEAQTLSTLPLHRIALGGYRILAPSNQAHAARMLLASVDEGRQQTGYAFDGALCEQCGGARFTRVKPWLLPTFLFVAFGMAAWWNSRRLRCTQCGAVTSAPSTES
jgi:hypothetical protein